MPGRVSVILKTRPREAEAYVLERLGLVVKKAAEDIEAGAKQRAPVRTGNLKNSIQASEEDPLTWRGGVRGGGGLYVRVGGKVSAAPAAPLPAPHRGRAAV